MIILEDKKYSTFKYDPDDFEYLSYGEISELMREIYDDVLEKKRDSVINNTSRMYYWLKNEGVMGQLKKDQVKEMQVYFWGLKDDC